MGSCNGLAAARGTMIRLATVCIVHPESSRIERRIVAPYREPLNSKNGGRRRRAAAVHERSAPPSMKFNGGAVQSKKKKHLQGGIQKRRVEDVTMGEAEPIRGGAQQPKQHFPKADAQRAAAPKANEHSRTSSTTRAHLTSARFASLPLSAPTRRAVAEVLGYDTMTLVQEQTLPVALRGSDVIAKAKTGTGKTIAFMLPTVERLAAHAAKGGGGGRRGVLALAISPTRELAQQIQQECEQLITFHKPALSSFVVVGGTNVHADVKRLTSWPPSLLVATPGRLNDLLANYGLDSLCAGLQVLIFDEADQVHQHPHAFHAQPPFTPSHDHPPYTLPTLSCSRWASAQTF